ncbi:MAG: glycosyltransferase family 4 protein [Candidatus Acidiferrales bacterium]
MDERFPDLATAFRIAEINYILRHFNTSIVYSTLSDRHAFRKYASCYPQNADRVVRFHPFRALQGEGAYVIFLNNIFAYLKNLEGARLPFVFELYPGGGFWLDNPTSDAHLRRVVDSPMFRKVIVTQNVTRNYLLRKHFCRRDQIEYIYGVVLQSHTLDEMAGHIARFGVNKNTVDICFVASKYVPRGVDKGYDRFIDCARILYQRHPEIHFHVVGNFTESDVEVSDLRGRITFYGGQLTPFFPKFYSRMDLIVSPNVPFLLAPGAFDGFPTGCCVEAALCGVAMFITDPLGMNENLLKDGEEVVIISAQPEEIAGTVEEYLADPPRLARLAQNGRRAIRSLFDIDAQMEPRLRVLSELLAAVDSVAPGGNTPDSV